MLTSKFSEACYYCATIGYNHPIKTKLCSGSYYKYKSSIFGKDYVDKRTIVVISSQALSLRQNFKQIPINFKQH